MVGSSAPDGAALTAYTNIRLWDGVSEDYSTFDSIVVEGESIVAMGRGLPGEDCTGLTALPGLIDAHVHMVLDPSIASLTDQLMQSESDIRDKMVRRAEAMVRHGITTARDLGGGNWLELELRDRIDAGEIIGPRLKCAGQPVTSVKGHCHFWGGEATDADAAVAVIQRQHEHGVDLIKVMATGGMQTPNSEPKDSQFDQPTLSAIVAAANDRGYPVAAHCHGTPGIREAAHAGVRSIEHCSWIGTDGKREPYDPSVAREIARRGIWVSPTVNAGWARYPEAFAERVRKNFRGLKAQGCRLVASTDAGIPNVRHEDLARALPVFARLAELTPLEVLRSATSECADALGLADVTGTLREGLAADLLFVPGDPLTDLSVLQRPAMVVARGRAFAPQATNPDDPGKQTKAKE